MQIIPLQSPTSFHFRTTDEWICWKRRFKEYWLASGLTTESAECQVSTLLYCIGEEAVKTKKKKIYGEVLAKFFEVRKKIIFERTIFNF